MTDNGVTIVDFAAMNEAVTTYKQKNVTIQEIIQAMKTIQTALTAANVFTGGAATSMLTAIGGYITALEAATGSLNGLVKLLEDKLTKYQEANKQAEAVANAIEVPNWSEA